MKRKMDRNSHSRTGKKTEIKLKPNRYIVEWNKIEIKNFESNNNQTKEKKQSSDRRNKTHTHTHFVYNSD